MNLIIDASVAVKWFVEEERRDLARDVLRDGFDLYAPDLALVEVANALRNKVRLGRTSYQQARASLTVLPSLFSRFIPQIETFREAFEIGCTINHSASDCVYLACVKILNTALLTDDAALFQKASSLDLGAKTLRLSDWKSGLPANPTV
ncbi:MAG TPA: type II toxin-antitoxin system VapC family toxin [Roseiarcus sp.]|nr:type II toxin-antitoxin system VapC family toxin [Roseiarcus sp.]